jgi:hypothetical protein
MLVDVRNIAFQGDPFARVDGADIYYTSAHDPLDLPPNR